MNGMLKFGTLAASAIVLAACSNAMDAYTGTSANTAFNNALSTDYATLKEAEGSEGDRDDAAHFDVKSKAAAANRVVGPDAMSSRKIAKDKQGDLAEARGRLVAARQGGFMDSHPKQLARAQAMWDCWLQEQEEEYQLLHIEQCRVGFERAMAQLKPAEKPVAKPAPAPAPTPAPEDRSFVVYFDFDKSKLSGDAQKTIQAAVREALSRNNGNVSIAGHTDRAGSAEYNLGLAERRSSAVAKAMETGGVANGNITTSYFGENINAVKTPDGQRQLANRRAEIIVSGR